MRDNFAAIAVLEEPMHHVRRADLPFVGSSHQFVGADQGDTGISAFLVASRPGTGPGPHRHPYDEVQFIESGRGRWKVDGVEFEAGGGEILVVKAGEIHEFKAIGEVPLTMTAIHLGPRFVQENLAG